MGWELGHLLWWADFSGKVPKPEVSRVRPLRAQAQQHTLNTAEMLPLSSLAQ